MKKRLIICLSTLVVWLSAFGQETFTTSLKHDNNELRFNLVTAIAGFPELNYERFVADNFGVGLSLAASLEKFEDMSMRAIAIPYCRVYFGEKKAAGFFIEGNMALANEKEYSYYYVSSGDQASDIAKSTSLGFGAAIGLKFLARNGVIGEVYLGGGRLFGASLSGGYPRVGVCIGKRF